MAASRAVTGNNWTFSIGTGSPVSYVEMLEVKSIKPDVIDVPDVSATHLKSPNSTEETIPGLIKPGKTTIMGNFIGDTSQLSILTLAQNQTVFLFKVEGPIDKGRKTYTQTGTAHVSKYGVGPFEQNKSVEFMLEIQTDGAVTESVV